METTRRTRSPAAKPRAQRQTNGDGDPRAVVAGGRLHAPIDARTPMETLLAMPRMQGPLVGTFVAGQLQRAPRGAVGPVVVDDQARAALQYEAASRLIQARKSTPAWSPSTAREALVALHAVIVRSGAPFRSAGWLSLELWTDGPGALGLGHLRLPKRVRVDLLRIVIGASTETLPISTKALLGACDTVESFCVFAELALGGWIPFDLIQLAEADLRARGITPKTPEVQLLAAFAPVRRTLGWHVGELHPAGAA